MKKYKQFIVGFVTCFILFSFIFIPGYAEDALQVMLNQFPITINGQQAEVEAYNINGRTFLALGDVAKYFDSTAMFNETEQRIEVNRNISNTSSTSSTTITSPVKIAFDITTEQPIGAEYVDYKGSKALKYNDSIYVDYETLTYKLNINVKYRIPEQQQIVYMLGADKTKTLTVNDDENNYVYLLREKYYKIDVFKELIGE